MCDGEVFVATDPERCLAATDSDQSESLAHQAAEAAADAERCIAAEPTWWKGHVRMGEALMHSRWRDRRSG